MIVEERRRVLSNLLSKLVSVRQKCICQCGTFILTIFEWEVHFFKCDRDGKPVPICCQNPNTRAETANH